MSKRRCTAEDTLLTFWPPAPCARIALISISPSGIAIAGKVFGMAGLRLIIAYSSVVTIPQDASGRLNSAGPFGKLSWRRANERCSGRAGNTTRQGEAMIQG